MRWRGGRWQGGSVLRKRVSNISTVTEREYLATYKATQQLARNSPLAAVSVPRQVQSVIASSVRLVSLHL
jgi:hypothetical protein